MIKKFYLIFCLIVLYKLDGINAEPIRRYSYVPPFQRNPTNLPVNGQPFNENENLNNDYDYLNSVSLGRLLQDDNTLIQQTDQLSDQVKNSIASRLMNLADRLQHAASILMDRSSRRSAHRNSHHTHRYRNYPVVLNSNGNNFNPKQPTNNSPRPTGDDLDVEKPPSENSSILNPKSTPRPASDQVSVKPSPSRISSNIESEFLNDKNHKREDEKDDKKKEDETESRHVRSKRDVDEYTNESSPFSSVTKSRLIDVSAEVKTGYDSVIKLLKNYLDNPPQIDQTPTVKRSNERAEKLLENIEEAKRIFNTIDDYVQQQYLDNDLANRNQTELLNYFDKIIRVEKNRIGQALSEYTNQLAKNYKLRPPAMDHNHEEGNQEEPARRVETEYQNDEDRDMNSYVNERNREIERESFRNRNTNSATNFYNEIPAEEKLRRVDRNEKPRATLIVRRVYIPPKIKSRATRRHPVTNDKIKPPYEASISHKEPVDREDEGEYEMVEP